MARVEMAELYPRRPGEEAGAWTNRVLSHSRDHEVNRQCSIGWHEECSDPRGESCRCLCHDKGVELWTVEGHVEGGVFTITRAEQGEHKWPPVEGEPATMWAHWVLGASEQDAKARALNKEAAALGLEPVKPEHLAAVPGMEAVKPEQERAGVTLTRDQLESWAGRALSDEEVEDLDTAIPDSSIPEAVAEIVHGWN